MIILLFIGYILSICLSWYFYLRRKKLSIRIAENYINDNVQKFIIEAQLNYSASDNIVLISKWINQIDKSKLLPHEWKLFINNLNSEYGEIN